MGRAGVACCSVSAQQAGRCTACVCGGGEAGSGGAPDTRCRCLIVSPWRPMMRPTMFLGQDSTWVEPMPCCSGGGKARQGHGQTHRTALVTAAPICPGYKSSCSKLCHGSSGWPPQAATAAHLCAHALNDGLGRARLAADQLPHHHGGAAARVGPPLDDDLAGLALRVVLVDRDVGLLKRGKEAWLWRLLVAVRGTLGEDGQRRSVRALCVPHQPGEQEQERKAPLSASPPSKHLPGWPTAARGSSRRRGR